MEQFIECASTGYLGGKIYIDFSSKESYIASIVLKDESVGFLRNTGMESNENNDQFKSWTERPLSMRQRFEIQKVLSW